jgi:hypothetical protein
MTQINDITKAYSRIITKIIRRVFSVPLGFFWLYISDRQKNVLTNVYYLLDDKIKANYNYIYIRCAPLVAFRRLQRRGRECEKKKTLEYLSKLHNEYKFFTRTIMQ